jgi:hypothetical protein
MLPTNLGNNIVTHISTVNSLDVERNRKKYDFIDENISLLNSKLSANNVNESILGRIFQVLATRELVYLTQTDKNDEYIEITTSQFGHASKPNSVNADACRKLPSWGKPSNKNIVKKGKNTYQLARCLLMFYIQAGYCFCYGLTHSIVGLQVHGRYHRRTLILNTIQIGILEKYPLILKKED